MVNNFLYHLMQPENKSKIINITIVALAIGLVLLSLGIYLSKAKSASSTATKQEKNTLTTTSKVDVVTKTNTTTRNVTPTKKVSKTLTTSAVINKQIQSLVSDERVMSNSFNDTQIDVLADATQGKTASTTPKITPNALYKDLAYKEIDRRVGSMKSMIEKVSSFKKITATQKNTLVAQINAEIIRLTNLTSKIVNDTKDTVLNDDKKVIVNTHNIFAFFLPKVATLSHANDVLSLVDLMLTKNPTGDALSKVNVAKTLATDAISNVMKLSSEGYPNNKTELQGIQKNLQIARVNLVNARALMK